MTEQNSNFIPKKNERNSAIELLRIFAIFSIVLCHFASHGGFNFSHQSSTLPRLWWNFIEMGGNFGVDVFVLISGYFLINNKNTIFNFTKLLVFYGQVFLYSILIFVIFYAIGYTTFDIKYFLPISYSVWWFASTYFVLFLIHPYINKLLHNLDKKQYQNLLILLTICWCIIPTLMNKDFQSNQLFEFIYLYTIAGYIRIYGITNNLKSKHYWGLFILFTLLTYLSCIALILLGTKIPAFSRFSLYFYGRNKIPTILRAIFIFIAFIKMKPFYNKHINKIASATFGVYLLHDNPILRKILWIDLFKNFSFQESYWIIPYSLCVCSLIYVACTIIDLIRQHSIEKIYIKSINRYYEKVKKLIYPICNLFKKILFGKQ